MLDDEIIGLKHGGFQRFLIKWRDRPISDATWVLDEELRRIAPDIYPRAVPQSQDSQLYEVEFFSSNLRIMFFIMT